MYLDVAPKEEIGVQNISTAGPPPPARDFPAPPRERAPGLEESKPRGWDQRGVESSSSDLAKVNRVTPHNNHRPPSPRRPHDQDGGQHHRQTSTTARTNAARSAIQGHRPGFRGPSHGCDARHLACGHPNAGEAWRRVRERRTAVLPDAGTIRLAQQPASISPHVGTHEQIPAAPITSDARLRREQPPGRQGEREGGWGRWWRGLGLSLPRLPKGGDVRGYMSHAVQCPFNEL
jgi:hypothetical protein